MLYADHVCVFLLNPIISPCLVSTHAALYHFIILYSNTCSVPHPTLLYLLSSHPTLWYLILHYLTLLRFTLLSYLITTYLYSPNIFVFLGLFDSQIFPFLHLHYLSNYLSSNLSTTTMVALSENLSEISQEGQSLISMLLEPNPLIR